MSPSTAITDAKARAAGLWPEHYHLIDACRGLAALAVCVHHVAAVNIGGPAVIAFFVISGYCISAAADSCLRKGYGLGTFMKRRVRRIFPPYLLSLAFWAATRLLKKMMSQENDLDRSLAEWVQNLTLTQWLTLLVHPKPSAADNTTLFVAAYWSLCYEEQFYLFMGLFMLLVARFGGSMLAWTVAIMGVGLAWNAWFPAICYGIFLEYWAIFALGVLVFYRLCRLNTPGARIVVDLSIWALLGACSYLRWFAGIDWSPEALGVPAGDMGQVRVIYEELAVACVFSLGLIYLRPLSERIAASPFFKPLAWLGLITFSLYLVHQFNLRLAAGVAGKILSVVPGSLAEAWPRTMHYVDIVLQLGVHVFIGTVFWFFCERPFLNKKLPPFSNKGPALAQAGAP